MRDNGRSVACVAFRGGEDHSDCVNETGTGSPVVEVRDLTVNRGGMDVVRDVTFSVDSGGVTGLLGPSGCGKTTLMRSVVGVQIIRSGTVEVLGIPAGHAKLRDRIGYVTQDASVYEDLSVTENLRFFARVLGVPTAEVDRF